MNSNFLNIIGRFTKINALVIGESMLDVYLKGEAQEICREAPVPKVAVNEEEYFPGAAANTAVNIASLGAKVKFLSVAGDDTEGRMLTLLLEKAGVENEIYNDRNRQTITKKRVMSAGHMLLRFDQGSVSEAGREAEKELISKLLALYKTMDLIIISDYGYGVLTEKVRNTITRLQDAYPKKLIIDSRHLTLYEKMNSTVIKPNFSEALVLLGITQPESGSKRIDQLTENKEKILALTNARYAAVTCDKDGAVVFGQEGFIYRTFSRPSENIKTSGAGDTYAAAFGLALAADAQIWEAAEIASKAAGIIIEKEGTARCTGGELSDFLAKETKIIGRDSKPEELISNLRQQGKTIVFTNGCFDIIHSGHVGYLSEAKKRGDILIVGVNSDRSVRKLKGKHRPVNFLRERMKVLAGLSSVDYVVPFSGSTPVKVINIIKPDMFVKGGDYTIDTLPEAKTVSSLGGKIEIIPFRSDKSTTATIDRIKQLFGKRHYNRTDRHKH